MPAAEDPKAGVCAEVLARSYPSLPFGLVKRAIWPLPSDQLPGFRSGSKVSVWPSAGYFRSAPISGHSQSRSACLKCAKLRHCHASCDYRVGRREQREYAGFL